MSEALVPVLPIADPHPLMVIPPGKKVLPCLEQPDLSLEYKSVVRHRQEKALAKKLEKKLEEGPNKAVLKKPAAAGGGVLHWREVGQLAETDEKTPLLLSWDLEDTYVSSAEWCAKSLRRQRMARHGAKRTKKLVMPHVYTSTYIALKLTNSRVSCWNTLPGGYRAFDDIFGILFALKDFEEVRKRLRLLPTPARCPTPDTDAQPAEVKGPSPR